MFSVARVSVAMYLISLILPAFSRLDGRESGLTFGVEALLGGLFQAFFGMVMFFNDFELAIMLILPWLANLSWLMSLVLSQDMRVNVWSLVTVLGLLIFFAYPIAMIGPSSTIADLRLHSGAYLWGIALILPLFKRGSESSA